MVAMEMTETGNLFTKSCKLNTRWPETLQRLHVSKLLILADICWSYLKNVTKVRFQSPVSLKH